MNSVKFKIRTNLCTGLIMGIASILLLIVLPEQVRLPAYDSGAPSPRIIPTLVLAGILIASICLVVQSLVFKQESIYTFELKDEIPSIFLIALMCVFVALIVNFGFIVGVCVVFPVMLFYFGERKPFIYIFSLAVGIGIYFLFRYVFNISLPGFGG